jgi:hypothetical protein
MTYADGSIYEGSWRDGARHGRGTFVGPLGTRYEGQWKDGEKHGRGTITYLNGIQYSGEWQKGKRHGYGVEGRPGSKGKEGYWMHDEYVGKEKPER